MEIAEGATGTSRDPDADCGQKSSTKRGRSIRADTRQRLKWRSDRKMTRRAGRRGDAPEELNAPAIQAPDIQAVDLWDMKRQWVQSWGREPQRNLRGACWCRPCREEGPGQPCASLSSA